MTTTLTLILTICKMAAVTKWTCVCCCSDQNDPFNRQPLSMDMVVPATDLRQRMEKWLQEKKQQH